MEQRYLQLHDIETRSDENTDDLYLEGLFATYGDVYQVWDGATESIAPGAFRNSINGDIRALFNHNDDIVLGRTTNGTLELRDTDKGLWGRIKINKKDTDAMNVYERIARGDITGCSFGFNIRSQEETITEDGKIHWTLTDIDPLYEVSPCVFPAYESTSIASRGKDVEQIKARMHEAWKSKMLKRLKGE